MESGVVRSSVYKYYSSTQGVDGPLVLHVLRGVAVLDPTLPIIPTDGSDPTLPIIPRDGSDWRQAPARLSRALRDRAAASRRSTGEGRR